MAIKVIVTGATGMAGEGVLFECLENPAVSDVLVIGRRTCNINHPKLKELVVPDFFSLASYREQWQGYDACFFCAGISSVGMKEDRYTYITYDTTLAFARTLLEADGKNMVFCYISGSHTDSSEKGRLMWARVKGRTENELLRLGFRDAYNFRPGVMSPVPGQKNVKKAYYPAIWLFKKLAPGKLIPLQELGRAMISAVHPGFAKKTLEIADIKQLAALA